MTSVQLNPAPSSFPAEELKEEQLQLFLSPHQASASLSSGPTNFFGSTSPEFQTGRGKLAGSHDHHHHQVDEYTTLISRSNGHIKLLSTSSTEAETSHVNKFRKSEEQFRDQLKRSSSEGSIKRMQSNMRLNCSETVKPVRFTVKFPDHHQDHSKECNSSSISNTIRVCSDCNTTTTPLWRSGPRGPKSLCNACGIRQRKARRAMATAAAAAVAVAANGSIAAMGASSMKTKVHNREKKSRSSHIAQCKKIFNKPLDHPPASSQTQKKLCFKNFALSLSKNSPLQQVFPRDVEEAAFLLMELSCGFIHS